MSRFTQITILGILIILFLFVIDFLKIEETQEHVETNANDALAENTTSIDNQRYKFDGNPDFVSTINQLRDQWSQLPLNAPDRIEWIENFPFNPGLSDEIPFDRARYERSSGRHNDWDVIMRAYRHGFLKAFYQNPTRYSKPFQEIWQILEEEGLGEDPMAVALIYNDLAYYHGMRSLDPDGIHDDQYPVMVPYELEDGSVGVRVEHKEITNAGFADELFEMISGKFFYDQIWIDREHQTVERADELRDRIVNEVDERPFLEEKWPVFAFNQDYEDELKDGDAMLIK